MFAKTEHLLYFFIGLSVIAVGTACYLWVALTTTEEKLAQTETVLESTRNEFTTYETKTTEELDFASTTIHELAAKLELTEEELEDVEDDLRDEKNKNDEFEDRIDSITKTVGVLDKLSKTDKELLQKYSKVYFLNEHYIPESIREIDKEYLYNEDRDQFLHAKVMPFFEDMVEDAKDEGVNLWVVSAYRSFDTQAQLKGQYLTTYGSGANAFSADQGYSEHQLGTTIDFTTNNLGGGLDGFGNTEAFEWLEDNAYKYGFTLSYDEDNAFYVYEPWHWRFVGTDLAKDLNRKNDHFYDWEQREIDEYLISIFD